MLLKDAFNAVGDLDLSPIKMKLMHVESGEGWSQARADAAEIEYRRFLLLAKTYPGEPLAPTVDVDLFWHYHILDTRKYAVDCQEVFGHFLHHYPYEGLDGASDEAARQRHGERMRNIYVGTFGNGAGKAELAWSTFNEDPPPPPPGTGVSLSDKRMDVGVEAFANGTGNVKLAWCTLSEDPPPPPPGTGISLGRFGNAGGKVKMAWCTLSEDPPPPPPGTGISLGIFGNAAGNMKLAWCTLSEDPPPPPPGTGVSLSGKRMKETGVATFGNVPGNVKSTSRAAQQVATAPPASRVSLSDYCVARKTSTLHRAEELLMT
jgi:hypothetical protein